MNTRTFLAGIFGLAMMAGGCVPPDDASLETQSELNGAQRAAGRARDGRIAATPRRAAAAPPT